MIETCKIKIGRNLVYDYQSLNEYYRLFTNYFTPSCILYNILYYLYFINDKGIMKTFKNKNFTKRDYEATNLVYCESETAPDENWVECDPLENSLNHLYTCDGVRYFGWL